MNKKDKKFFSGIKAFTLAETLIALVVIGVVAAITVPNIMDSYKKQQTVTRLKGGFSILTQAVNSAKKDHGDISGWEMTLTNKEFAETYILPYVNYSQTKETYSMATLSVQHNTDSRHLFWSWNVNSNPIYSLANGSTFVVTASPSNIGGDGSQPVWIVLDVNGSAGPNTLGRDGFCFNINPSRNQLTPAGYSQPRAKLLSPSGPLGACVTDSTWQYYRGATCAALIMADSWEMKDDYPWKKAKKNQ